MFHSAALKLTAWYLAIIMLLSIGCSVVIYGFANDQLINNTRRQVYFFNDELAPSDFSTFANLRHRQLAEGQNRLRDDLLVFNLLVFFIGGGVSYLLARRTLQPIESALEAQKRFTGDASHELRTPLAAMQTETEVALRNRDLTKQQAVKLLKSNLEEVAKLKALSEGLLALANSASKASLNDSVPVKGIIAQAVDRFERAAKAKKIRINTQSKNLSVRGSQESLAELAGILIDNAVKYSPSGSQISIRSDKKDKSVYISVSDEGQGIEAAQLPRIFERFYRADTSRNKEKAAGYGLGLAIAKNIVELHNGHIEVKSAPGKGSTFTIYLPQA